MAKQTTVSEDADNARRLEEHARNILATNQRHPQRSWFERNIPWPLWFLATIGTAVCLFVALAMWWPLMLLSYRYYFG